MAILDKHGSLVGAAPISLELGCGAHRQFPGAISTDVLDTPAVDVVGDVMEVLAAIADGRVDRVCSWHFLEHVEDQAAVLAELSRVVRDAGIVEFTVPHFSNPYFYSDPTHRSFFGLYTFSYLARDRFLKRKVPQYAEPIPFDLIDVRMTFRGDTFRYRGLVKRALGYWIGRSRAVMEFYEENLTGLFPCYELTYVLERRKR
ncbi:MAG TPA: methyltransferase domain-containing protein [Nonomuraea sp.]|nr:methyltransferase domain-containing protein [Nonomuraea sp.]